MSCLTCVEVKDLDLEGSNKKVQTDGLLVFSSRRNDQNSPRNYKLDDFGCRHLIHPKTEEKKTTDNLADYKADVQKK